MKKILILSKLFFDRTMKEMGLTPDNVEKKASKAAFISILDSGDSDPEAASFFPEDRSNVKTLFFDDVEKDMQIPEIGTGRIRHIKAFTEHQAEELLAFIKQNANKSLFIIHCTAGISRSGAVGQFICDYFSCNPVEFRQANPNILPNNLVSRLLKAAVIYEDLNVKLQEIRWD